MVICSPSAAFSLSLSLSLSLLACLLVELGSVSSHRDGYNGGVSVRDLLPSERRRKRGIDDATRRALQWFVMPIWIGAGLADWWCHRRTDIEHTAGATESAIHVGMLFEGGVPAMLGLFCEVNSGVLAVTYGTVAVHELTAVWDVTYADGRREVTSAEQYVHGFLGRVPLMATVLLTVLHWDQARSLLGMGGARDWRLKAKRRGLTRRYRAGVLASLAVVAAPYGEELVRCVRAKRPDEST
jgi:hypothetical protein